VPGHVHIVQESPASHPLATGDPDPELSIGGFDPDPDETEDPEEELDDEPDNPDSLEDPEIPDPGDPEESEEPAEPDEPDVPEVPEVPEEPDELEEPDEPEIPEESEEPDEEEPEPDEPDDPPKSGGPVVIDSPGSMVDVVDVVVVVAFGSGALPEPKFPEPENCAGTLHTPHM